MNTYLIAGIKVNMSPCGRTKEQAEKYLTEYTQSPDIVIDIPDRVIDKACEILKSDDREEGYYLASGFAFYRKLVDFNGFMLHSSAVCIGDSAYLFSGQSGIGKSTHTSLWQKLLGDKCKILNDDKPAVRFENGNAYVYGTPWSGKHDKSENIRAKLCSVCFISRADTNSIMIMDKKTSALNIISQCPKNFTEKQWDLVLSYIDALVNKVPVYKLMCNKDISAAKLSYQTLTGGTL